MFTGEIYIFYSRFAYILHHCTSLIMINLQVNGEWWQKELMSIISLHIPVTNIKETFKEQLLYNKESKSNDIQALHSFLPSEWEAVFCFLCEPPPESPPALPQYLNKQIITLIQETLWTGYYCSLILCLYVCTQVFYLESYCAGS